MNIEKILKVEPSPLERSRRKKSRVFLWDIDQNIVDLVTHRHSRGVEEYVNMIPEAAEAAGLTGPSEYTYFSRVCTCGCTPGFLANEWLRDERGVPYDLHITYTKKAVGKKPQVLETEFKPEPDEGTTVELPTTEEESKAKSPVSVEDMAERRRANLAKAREARAAKRREAQEAGDRIPFAAKRSYKRKITLRDLPGASGDTNSNGK